MRLEAWERRMKHEYRGKMPQLVERAAWCHDQLVIMTSLTTLLLEDEHFITLLRAEGLFTLPACLRKHITVTVRSKGNE